MKALGRLRPFSKNLLQSGNIMLALFAAIGAVGIVGATGMTVLKGPVRSMHTVTQKTIAENNMIASSKLAVMAAANQASGGDCDADSTVEPVAWSTSGTGPFPTGGGYLPSDIGASLQDPWGNTYGYCVWDHGAAIQTTCPTPTQRLRGAGVGGSGPVISIISSGPDRTFQTTCANSPTYVTKVSGSDDIVLSYTYAEAQSASGGLWNLQSSDLNTAEIQKNLEVKNALGTTTFDLDRETGIGDFIGIRTGSIAAKGVEPVIMAGGLKMDNDTNVTQCSLPQHKGILRYHMDDGLQVCDGTAWASAGGGAVPAGTIAAFASNTCPGGWSEYSPARGRFLRGRDPSGTNDAVRNAGDIQTDSNKSHAHTGTAASAGAHGHTGTAASAGSHTHTGSTASAGSHGHSVSASGRILNGSGTAVAEAVVNGINSPTGFPVTPLSGLSTNSAGDHAHGLSLNAAGDHAHALTINSAVDHTHALTINADGGTETRPKNVAVTFCQYDGGAPVTAIAGLDNLSDVVLSAPQVGQVLTYDGTNWINGALTSSQWITSGANIYYNTGNVGIGTVSPQRTLDIQSSTYAVARTRSTGTTGFANFESRNDTNVGYDFATYGSAVVSTLFNNPVANASVLYGTGSSLMMGTSSTTPLILGTNATERMRIASDGSVGIGVSAPAYKLQVGGSIAFDGTIIATGTGTIRDAGGGWMRTYNNTGWYSQTYGGGLYMVDTNYVRTYGGKALYATTANNATPGLYAYHTGSHNAVQGEGTSGYGVYGTSASSYGVTGRPGSTGYGGVLGYTQNATYYGILGHANAYSFYGNGTMLNNGIITPNGNRITDVGAPSAASDAATKAYVDSKPTGGISAATTASCTADISCTVQCPATYFRTGCSGQGGSDGRADTGAAPSGASGCYCYNSGWGFPVSCYAYCAK